jgi:starvation-inducible outer membrane lipoprotein
MKMAIRTTLIATAMLMLAACGGPTLDGENEAAFQQSLKEVMGELPQNEVVQLGKDLELLSTETMKELGGMNVNKMPEMESIMMEMIDGKSAADVHDMAEKVRNK